MQLINFSDLKASFTGSKNSGYFEFTIQNYNQENETNLLILSSIKNTFIVNKIETYYNYDKLENLISVEHGFCTNFFFYGYNDNKEPYIDFINYSNILKSRIYRDGIFELIINENLFTDEIYYYQNGENNDRVAFNYAAKLNRELLNVALQKIEKDTNSEISDYYCELPIKIGKYGFDDNAFLDYDRQF